MPNGPDLHACECEHKALPLGPAPTLAFTRRLLAAPHHRQTRLHYRIEHPAVIIIVNSLHGLALIMNSLQGLAFIMNTLQGLALIMNTLQGLALIMNS